MLVLVQKIVKITILIVFLTNLLVLTINLVNQLFFIKVKMVVMKFIKAVLEEYQYYKKK